MPAVSVKQRRYFGWLEHSPDAAAERAKSGMSKSQMHDFASTPEKGLPSRAEHMADGGGNWAKDAFAKAGEKGHSLHATLGVPQDKPIPAYRVREAVHSENPHTRAMAQADLNINRRKYFGQK